MATISAVPFSALPVTDDGYTLLNDNDVVHRSSKKLSELVGDKTSSFLTKEQGDSLYQEKGDYLVDDDITGKLDKSQYAVDSATFLTAHQSLDEYATQEWVNNQGFLKEHQSISANEWNDVYETVVTNSGTWETETDWTDDINAASANALSEAKDWVEEQNYITGVDLTNYYTKSETSGANEISAALDGKEDKVFVAEYGVTTYADIKAAYDAGKQIICKYVENEAQTKYISLSQFVKPGNIFIFSDWATNGQSIYVHFTLNVDGNTGYQVISNSYYAKNETSGRVELTSAFNTKQDKLTFAGTSNTITSINNSAIGVGGAGGDYVPLNAVECTIGSGNSSETGSFAQGKDNSASQYSFTQGNHNVAGSYAMAQGNNNEAVYQSFAQGSNNTASQNSFAQGYYNKSYSTGVCFGSQNSANTYSFTQGDRVTAYNYSFAAGKYNYAENYSQTFGFGLKATNYAIADGYDGDKITQGSFVIGEFNKTSAAPFVIGNGTFEGNRSDLFVVDKDGNVSAQGQFFAEGGILGAALDTLELAPDNETIEFVTSSHNVVNGEGEQEEYTVIKIKQSLLDKINKIDELYNLVSSNSSIWV